MKVEKPGPGAESLQPGWRLDDHPRRSEKHDQHPGWRTNPLGQLLLCLLSRAHLVVRDRAHQSDSTLGPGGVAHLDRMATLRAQDLRENARDRQGTAIDRGGHRRGDVVHLGSVGRSGARHADEDRRALH